MYACTPRNKRLVIKCSRKKERGTTKSPLIRRILLKNLFQPWRENAELARKNNVCTLKGMLFDMASSSALCYSLCRGKESRRKEGRKEWFSYRKSKQAIIRGDVDSYQVVRSPNWMFELFLLRYPLPARFRRAMMKGWDTYTHTYLHTYIHL